MRHIPIQAYFYMIAMTSIISVMAYFRYRREIAERPVNGEFWWKISLAAAYFGMLAALAGLSAP